MLSFSPRTQAILFFLGIFAIGLVCGAIAERRFLRAPGPRGRPYPRVERLSPYARVVERLSHHLELSDEQKKAVQIAFRENHEEIENMRRQIGEHMHLQEQKLREKLQTILTPEQFELFEERNKHRGFRGRGGGRRGPPGGPPPGPHRSP